MKYLTYAREKLGLAVDALVGPQPSYRQRMLDAYRHWHVLDPNNLPDDLAEEIRRLRDAISWLPPSDEEPDEGSIEETLREMSAEEYKELAQLIVRLFEKVVERAAAQR